MPGIQANLKTLRSEQSTAPVSGAETPARADFFGMVREMLSTMNPEKPFVGEAVASPARPQERDTTVSTPAPAAEERATAKQDVSTAETTRREGKDTEKNTEQRETARQTGREQAIQDRQAGEKNNAAQSPSENQVQSATTEATAASKETTRKERQEKPKQRHGTLDEIGRTMEQFIQALLAAKQGHDARPGAIAGFNQAETQAQRHTGQAEQSLRRSLAKIEAMVTGAFLTKTARQDVAKFESVFAQLKSLLPELAAKQGKQETRTSGQSREITAAAIRDLTAKIENLVLAIQQKSDRPATEEHGSNGQFQFQFMKNAAQLKPEMSATAALRQQHPFAEQMQQFIDQARVTVRDQQNGNIVLRLNPRELGSVNVKIGLDQGVVNGTFLVDTPEAKAAIVENLWRIQDELRDAGISVGEFSVNVRDEQPHHAFQEDRKSNASPAGTLPRAQESELYGKQSQYVHQGAVNVVI